jgi:8-oxo-dGTP pyrophosphatase MutT (NUDIX family)
VLLIKRAAATPQSGDLAFPGGLIHPSLDACLRPLLSSPLLSIVPTAVRQQNRRHGTTTWRLVSLLLTTALRESWEEIGLAPWQIAFQGPLPTYSLRLFRRTIFPLVGWVRRPRRLRANAAEVEKIVPLPLAAFTQEERFGRLVLTGADGEPGPAESPTFFPCLIHPLPDGGREILWGATFQILLGLLGLIADYRLPDPIRGPVIYKRIGAAYLTGTPPS